MPETLVETLNNIEDLAFLKQLLLETVRVNSVAEFEELIEVAVSTQLSAVSLFWRV